MPTPNMYELYEDGKMAGIYRNREVAEILDIIPSSVYGYANRGTLIDGKYQIRKSNLTYSEAMKLMQQLPKEKKAGAARQQKPSVVIRKRRGKIKYSSGRTFNLPEWDKDGKLKII